MPLHRDIFWVGRQWAVTGHGIQAVDQKQKSKFDIEISRLWDDDLLDGLSAERWFNLDDFSQGLAIAKARYPEPPHHAKSAKVEPSQPRFPPVKPVPEIEPIKPVVAKFAMRLEAGSAKFTPMWRIRIRR